MTSTEFVRVEREGRVLVVTIDREEVRNALHPPACQEMSKLFDDFVADPELWVAIVTGAGDKAFSAGNDLKYQAQQGRSPRSEPEASEGQQLLAAFPATGFGGLTHRFDCPKPILAAVNGMALGGGFELALACDLVVAAESAFFGVPEVRVGTAPLAGGLHRLPRLIGLNRALDLVLTGRHVTASELHAMGVVREVVPDGQALAATRALAQQILEAAPLAVRASKTAMLQGLALPLREALERRFPVLDELVRSEDYREGAVAFAEKRKPAWRGR